MTAENKATSQYFVDIRFRNSVNCTSTWNSPICDRQLSKLLYRKRGSGQLSGQERGRCLCLCCYQTIGVLLPNQITLLPFVNGTALG